MRIESQRRGCPAALPSGRDRFVQQARVARTDAVEFADRDARASPVQLARDEPLARELFPLAERLEPEPWMGRRPCLPDMVPVIGKGERHHGLWFAFGHAHHGFTLGPVTGRLLAEMMTGDELFTEPSCYVASRFGNGVS